jgi:hypothetical protein
MTRKYATLIVFDTDLYLASPETYAGYDSILVLCLGNDERNIALGEPVLAFKQKLVRGFVARCANANLIDTDNIMEMSSSIKGVDVIYPFVGDNLDYLKRLAARTNLELQYSETTGRYPLLAICKKGIF